MILTWTSVAPAVSAAFLSSLVEAVEALTIVLAVATVRGWRPAGLGALAAAVGLALRRPLARVPENTLKFTVGVMLSSFGVFWTGEGLGVPWPGEDLAILGFAALFLVAAVAAVRLVRSPAIEALP